MTILTHGNLANLCGLWTAYKESIYDDCVPILRRCGFENSNEEHVESLALLFVVDILAQFGKTLHDFNLPHATIPFDDLEGNRLIHEGVDYTVDDLCNEVVHDVGTLNIDQRQAYNAIVSMYESGESNFFFIDGSGGMGKTYIENLLLKRFVEMETLPSQSPHQGLPLFFLMVGAQHILDSRSRLNWILL